MSTVDKVLVSKLNPNVVIVSVLVFTLAIISIVAGLVIAGRPVGNVVELIAAVSTSTIPAMLGLIGVQKLSYDVRNGVGDLIAEKAASKVATNVANELASKSNA